MAADVLGRDFTMVHNAALRDRRLTRRARGLLVEVLSHRAGFSISEASLVAAGPEGRDAVRKALRELETYGYLHREQGRAGGRFGETVFRLTDMPDGLSVGAPSPWTDSQSTVERCSSGPLTGKPSTEKPTTENPLHKKTKFQKINLSPAAEPAAADTAGTEDVTAESENPAPQTEPPTPVPAAAADVPPERTSAPRESDVPPRSGNPEAGTVRDAQSGAGGLVADALAAQWRTAHGTAPGRRQLQQIAADATDAIADGDTPDWLTNAVVPFMVRRRYLDLGRARTHRDCPPPRTAGTVATTADGMCPEHPTYRAGNRCIPCVMA